MECPYTSISYLKGISVSYECFIDQLPDVMLIPKVLAISRIRFMMVNLFGAAYEPLNNLSSPKSMSHTSSKCSSTA